MTTRIIGTGSSLPRQTVTNEDLSKIMDTSDEWISSRTGIRERHLAKEETTASLSVEAAGKALQNAGVSAISRPIPLLAPVTKATFPSSIIKLLSSVKVSPNLPPSLC